MALEVALGLSTGYCYTLAKTKEDEVRQGGNRYQASLCQGFQLNQFTNLSSFFLRLIPYTPLRLGATALNTTASITSVVVCPLMATVKEGHYEAVVKSTNAPLPSKLSKTTTRILSYTSDHLGDILRYGMIAGTMALPFIGSPYFAGAMIVPVVYEAADSRKWVPRRISRVMENYMPAISSAFLLIGGGIGTRIFSAFELISYSPRLSQALHRKIDSYVHTRFAKEGPTLEEIDSPLATKKELSSPEIWDIINADGCEFEINAAHCSKFCSTLVKLPENRNFNELIVLFDQVNWEKEPLLAKFRDDDRFIGELKEKFPDQNVLEDFEILVQELAGGKTLNEFFALKLREQFLQMIKYLNGEDRPKGYIQDLDDAGNNCAKILPHLQSLNLEICHERTAFVDTLMKLGVEGGDYCARGLKRASTEIVQGILNTVSFESDDDYERRLMQTLELMRLKILETFYMKLIASITDGANETSNKVTTNKLAVTIGQDVHTMDLYRLIISLGFYPLTYNERRNVGMMHLFYWEVPPYSVMRSMMYQLYQHNLNEVIHEVGLVHFGIHMHRLIQSNPKLTDEEKDKIIDRLCPDDVWDTEEVQNRFSRLMLYMLGVIKKKSIYEEPFHFVEEKEQNLEDEWVEL